MRVVAVLDIMGGQVVRGRAGRRAEYRPITSVLTSSSEPVAVAEAIRERLGLEEFYLADLDAIAGAEPAWVVYERLHALGCRLWVDAGVREANHAAALLQAGVSRPVLGLETLSGPAALHAAGSARGGDRLIFSLDLCEGRPLGQIDGWGSTDPASIVGQAVALGTKAVLVLDLSRVGMGGGTGTENLCGALAKAYPTLEIAAGGGIRGVADIRRLSEQGVSAVLLASALHDGALSREDLAAL